MNLPSEDVISNYPAHFRRQILNRAGKKKKGGSVLGAVASWFAKLGLNWGLKAIKERFAAKHGGKIEPKDWIHFAAGPWGWLHLALRERDRKKYKEDQKKMKQTSGGMYCGMTRYGPTTYSRYGGPNGAIHAAMAEANKKILEKKKIKGGLLFDRVSDRVFDRAPKGVGLVKKLPYLMKLIKDRNEEMIRLKKENAQLKKTQTETKSA